MKNRFKLKNGKKLISALIEGSLPPDYADLTRLSFTRMPWRTHVANEGKFSCEQFLWVFLADISELVPLTGSDNPFVPRPIASIGDVCVIDSGGFYFQGRVIDAEFENEEWQYFIDEDGSSDHGDPFSESCIVYNLSVKEKNNIHKTLKK